MANEHNFTAQLRWTGGPGPDVASYSRDYTIETPGKPPVPGSAPSVFKGSDARHSPEDFLLESLSACHLLTYLSLAARADIRVTSYTDSVSGTLAMKEGKMRMVDVLLKPVVTVDDPAKVAEATALHGKAHGQCFIANSVNFPVRNEPVVTAA